MSTDTLSLENRLFFKRWLRHPFQLGTLAPISQKFASYAASLLPHTKGPIVEVGAGTGRLTRALLQHGVQPQELAAIELDSTLCDFLRQTIPQIHVIEADARYIAELIPSEWVGEVSTIVSVIPFMYLSMDARLEIVSSCFQVMAERGTFLQVTYSARSPLKGVTTLLGKKLLAKRVGRLLWNLPPGFVWQYQLV